MNTNYRINTQYAISKARAAGEATALNYKPGDVFLGASPECERQGFAGDPLARHAFISAYLACLSHPIRTRRGDNVIVQYGSLTADERSRAVARIATS